MQFILSHLEDHFMGKLGVSKREHSSKISEHKFLFFEFADHIEELTINCSLVFFPLFSNCVNLFLGVEDVSLSMFWLLQLLSLEVFIIDTIWDLDTFDVQLCLCGNDILLVDPSQRTAIWVVGT